MMEDAKPYDVKHYETFNVFHWEPIETAPKDGSQFLAYMAIGAVEIAYYDTKYGNNEFRIDAYAPPLIPEDWMTHWMPLPPPPK